MKPIESAYDLGLRILRAAQPREFYEELCNGVEVLIEADRRAVRLALLSELDAEADRGDASDTGDRYLEARDRLRGKYGKP